MGYLSCTAFKRFFTSSILGVKSLSLVATLIAFFTTISLPATAGPEECQKLQTVYSNELSHLLDVACGHRPESAPIVIIYTPPVSEGAPYPRYSEQSEKVANFWSTRTHAIRIREADGSFSIFDIKSVTEKDKVRVRMQNQSWLFGRRTTAPVLEIEAQDSKGRNAMVLWTPTDGGSANAIAGEVEVTVFDENRQVILQDNHVCRGGLLY